MIESARKVLFNIEQTYEADSEAIRVGCSGLDLMEAAGAAVSDEIRLNYNRGQAVILCGPGNNGGDGFVVARRLSEAGWQVRVALLGETEKLSGDARVMAGKWGGSIEKLEATVVDGASLIVDGIFGAGLKRQVDGDARATLEAADRSCAAIVAIDVPSGVDGDTGRVLGYAAQADRCVTFSRKKLGHALLPGKEHCGSLKVAPIGVPCSILNSISCTNWENGPELWADLLAWPNPNTHKYQRGYAIITSGGAGSTGAARLAARAALRVGTGLVNVICPAEAILEFAAEIAAIIKHPCSGTDDFARILSDGRTTAVLVGPGNGVNDSTKELVLEARKRAKPCVLDADALNVFSASPEALFDIIGSESILTPHDGEFARLFPDLKGTRLERARSAAERCGSVVLLKGGDTVIASPNGHCVVNTQASPALATAGSGDVLAGIAVGLLAQSLPAFEAACAAAYIHGQTSMELGLGLVADDLVAVMPSVINRLWRSSSMSY